MSANGEEASALHRINLFPSAHAFSSHSKMHAHKHTHTPMHTHTRILSHARTQKLNVCAVDAFLLSFLALVSFKQKKECEWVIRNPHALLIDDGQLAKNAHKTQKSDWTPGGRGRGRRAWRERALDKNEGSRATTLFCVNRDRLYDSRPGWNLKIRPSGAAAAAAAAGGSCTQGRQLKLSKQQQQLLFDPVRKRFFLEWGEGGRGADATWSVVTHSSLAVDARKSICNSSFSVVVGVGVGVGVGVAPLSVRVSFRKKYYLAEVVEVQV